MSRKQVWAVIRVVEGTDPMVVSVGSTRELALQEALLAESANIKQFWRDMATLSEDASDTWREDANDEIDVMADAIQYLCFHPEAIEAYSKPRYKYIVARPTFATI